jgi:hypothetical protein
MLARSELKTHSKLERHLLHGLFEAHDPLRGQARIHEGQGVCIPWLRGPM